LAGTQKLQKGVNKMTEKALFQKAKKTSHGVVKVHSRPKCDFCGREAVVDGKTHFGPWANMCLDHFLAFGVGLGLGKGQFLVIEE
jgi:transposase-like protein